MAEGGAALIGPMQVMSFVLEEPRFDGRILDQIAALEEAGIITLIDAAVVVRASEDEFTAIDADVELLEGRPLLGAVVGGLIGLGAAGAVGAVAGAEAGAATGIDPVTSDDLIDLAEELPVGAAAAVVVFEQAWARGLMGAIRDGAGTIITDDVIHAEDLVDIGVDLAVLAEIAGE